MAFKSIHLVFIIGAMFSCSETNSEKQSDGKQVQNISSQNISQTQKPTLGIKINTSNLIGIWGDGIGPNALFEVQKDHIYYTEEGKSYNY